MTARLTTLRFRSGRYGTSDFHQTPPREASTLSPFMPLSLQCGVPSVRVPRGLTSFEVHLLFYAHAGRTPSLAWRLAAAAQDDNVS